MPTLTLNYGLRFDHFTAYTSGQPGEPARQRRLAGAAGHDACTPAIRAISRRRRSNWSATRPSRRFADTTGAAPLPAGDAAAWPSSANYYDVGVQQKLSQRLHGGPRQLLQAVAQPDRRGPIRRADHPDAVQLPLRQAVRRRVHRQLHADGFIRVSQSRRTRAPRASRSTRRSSISRPTISPTSPNNYIHLDHEQQFTGVRRRLLSVARHALQRRSSLGSGLRADLVLRRTASGRFRTAPTCRTTRRSISA